MATLNRTSQRTQKGVHTRKQIEQIQRPALARDDLYNAFAGDENQGPHKDPQDTQMHSTSVKSRKTEKSKDRIPKR